MIRPGKVKWIYKLILPVLGLLLQLMLTAACAGQTAEPAGTTGSAVTTAAATSAAAAETTAGPNLAARPAAASGVLRLWWSARQNLNPLLEVSQSGLAINSLIYDGLFEIDAGGQAQLKLAERMTVSADGLKVQIRLCGGLAFHDGQPVQAADAAACLEFILASAGSSAYTGELAAIAAAETPDSLTLELTLSHPDPWLAWALTFPVIPASRLDAGPFDLVAGTGDFQMQSYDAAEGLSLVKVRPCGELSELLTIRVREYDSLSAAMQGFADDEIDLIGLSADDYYRYELRGNLRFEPYLSRQLLILAFNTKIRQPLADSGRLLFLKQLLNSDSLQAAGAGIWGECTPVNLPLSSYLLDGQSAGVQSVLDSLGQPDWDESSRELVFLMPENDFFRLSIAELLGNCLTEAGVPWRMEILADPEYQLAIGQGEYDLTILEAVLPNDPDPTWLYRADRPMAYNALSVLDGSGLADYELWRERLIQASNPNRADPAVGGYPSLLRETAARSPWNVLMIRSAAILYGSRVIGQCRPDCYNPYQGIEELWIWSGQSS